ncbi:hypothetical protein [Streptomyces sp. NPDC059863]|uniref:hypothetical protein n=1 Tax=unclassified Streptomyces TaxID=2593676 RepID=UPI00365DF719
MIIDALDEALRPEEITATVLLPLTRATGYRLRLLVGTREDPRFRSLLAAARDHGDVTDLSAAEPQAVRRSLATYVNRLLTTDGCPYADASLRGFRSALAEAIACQLTGHRPRTTRPDPAGPWSGASS